MNAPLNEGPEFEIARFLKRLQWLVQKPISVRKVVLRVKLIS